MKIDKELNLNLKIYFNELNKKFKKQYTLSFKFLRKKRIVQKYINLFHKLLKFINVKKRNFNSILKNKLYLFNKAFYFKRYIKNFNNICELKNFIKKYYTNLKILNNNYKSQSLIFKFFYLRYGNNWGFLKYKKLRIRMFISILLFCYLFWSKLK